jgi:membrane protein
LVEAHRSVKIVTSNEVSKNKRARSQGHVDSSAEPIQTVRLTARRRAAYTKGSAVARRAKAGVPGKLWTRLDAVDFMNSSMQFAALSMLCLFPFLIILSAATGRDVRRTIVERLGLDADAAKDINELIFSGKHAVTALTVLGAIFLILGALGIASTLQVWYERVNDQPAPTHWSRVVANRAVWVIGMVLYISLQALVGRELGSTGARVPAFVVEFVIAVVFWWWTADVLLLNRVSMRLLFPAGLATGVCVTGLTLFSSLFFSNSIVSSHDNYGPIGVVMVLLSYLIGLGVCLHLGSVLGRMWNERRQEGRLASSG